MKTRRHLVLGLLLLVALGWATWQALRKPRQTEPVYDGMPLSYWLGAPGTRPNPKGMIDTRSNRVATSWYPDDRLAEFWAQQLVSDSNAIPFFARAITKVPRPDPPRPFGLEENLSNAPWVWRIATDSNAIPFLVRALKGDTWSTALYRRWIWPRLPPTLRGRLPPPPHLDRARAALLLGYMGPMAKPAIPVLVKVMKEAQGWYFSRVAVWALGSIGGPSAEAAVMESLNDKDPEVRYNAAHALMGMDPQTAEPSNWDLFPNFRIEVAIALGELGKDAQPAIPALTTLLRDTNRIIRAFATNAMRQIDPEAAAKAGIKGPPP
jgi:hypothetical protein